MPAQGSMCRRSQSSMRSKRPLRKDRRCCHTDPPPRCRRWCRPRNCTAAAVAPGVASFLSGRRWPPITRSCPFCRKQHLLLRIWCRQNEQKSDRKPDAYTHLSSIVRSCSVTADEIICNKQQADWPTNRGCSSFVLVAQVFACGVLRR